MTTCDQCPKQATQRITAHVVDSEGFGVDRVFTVCTVHAVELKGEADDGLTIIRVERI